MVPGIEKRNYLVIKMIFVPFKNGKPSGKSEEFISYWLY